MVEGGNATFIFPGIRPMGCDTRVFLALTKQYLFTMKSDLSEISLLQWYYANLRMNFVKFFLLRNSEFRPRNFQSVFFSVVSSTSKHLRCSTTSIRVWNWAGVIFTRMSIRSPSDRGLISGPEKYLSNLLISSRLVEHAWMVTLLGLHRLLHR